VEARAAIAEKRIPREAVREFESCLANDKLYVPGWEGLAAAHQRLGHAEQSEKCAQQAKFIRERVLQDRVEAAVRSEHPLWKKR